MCGEPMRPAACASRSKPHRRFGALHDAGVQDLDRDAAMDERVRPFVHGAHAAFADHADYDGTCRR